jgi:hypothetical protein
MFSDQQSRYLGVGVDCHEAAAELVALADLDQLGVVLRPSTAEGQHFLEHHCDLHAVRRSHGVELEGMAAGRKILVVRGPGDRADDVCELVAVRLFQVRVDSSCPASPNSRAAHRESIAARAVDSCRPRSRA